jgi:excinuclease ABC subunit C
MPFVFEPHRYPEQPGCYIMRGEDGRALYIGKSVNLRSRLRSYFHQPLAGPRFRELVRHVASIEVILTTNETESLTLENHLIKMHRPPVNRALKREDSGFGELLLTAGTCPMLRASFRRRRMEVEGSAAEPDPDDGATARFGPAGEWCLKTLAEFLSDRFRLRTCDPMPDEVCFRWHLGRCGGVCAGHETEAAYAERARQVAELLAGDGGALADLLRAEMERCSERLDFERAAEMLRLVRALERETDAQIVDLRTRHDQDVLYLGEDGMLAARIKRGMLSSMTFLGAERFGGIPDDRAIVGFYGRAGAADDVPDEVIVNRIGDARRTAEALRRLKGASVRITVPKRGTKLALVRLCELNYLYRREAAASGGGVWV